MNIARRRLTAFELNEAFEDAGTVCPRCRNGDWETIDYAECKSPFDEGGHRNLVVKQIITCFKCSQQWVLVFNLAGVEDGEA